MIEVRGHSRFERKASLLTRFSAGITDFALGILRAVTGLEARPRTRMLRPGSMAARPMDTQALSGRMALENSRRKDRDPRKKRRAESRLFDADFADFDGIRAGVPRFLPSLLDGRKTALAGNPSASERLESTLVLLHDGALADEDRRQAGVLLGPLRSGPPEALPRTRRIGLDPKLGARLVRRTENSARVSKQDVDPQSCPRMLRRSAVALPGVRADAPARALKASRGASRIRIYEV
jgi:hypothetical protein